MCEKSKFCAIRLFHLEAYTFYGTKFLLGEIQNKSTEGNVPECADTRVLDCNSKRSRCTATSAYRIRESLQVRYLLKHKHRGIVGIKYPRIACISSLATQNRTLLAKSYYTCDQTRLALYMAYNMMSLCRTCTTWLPGNSPALFQRDHGQKSPLLIARHTVEKKAILYESIVRKASWVV